jgi:hypothetical protein
VASSKSELNRRQFIRTTGAAAVLGVPSAAASKGISLVIDPADSVADSAPAAWAASELEQSLKARGITVSKVASLSTARQGDLCIMAAGLQSPAATALLKASGTAAANKPEALGLASGTLEQHRTLLATGYDSRGLVYALLDLADRVSNSSDPMADLTSAKNTAEEPANPVRSMMRMFTSDVEDKPWYNDREMWPQYLSMLASQRFNRFNLAFGIGYDFIKQVTDAYFLFAYPFLLSVPGHNVRVPQLPASERDNNLAMLKFISEQTVARGMQFQLGLWMHGYVWIDSPHANYTIEGLNRTNHGSYCRDAVRMLLRECPAISGVTFRIHGESGVEEGSYEFWKEVFDGVATCGRTVEIDMHPKGLTQEMIDIALATRMPLRLSPKFWAEHMGMTYHQADIRELEQPKEGKETSGLMKFSAGSRSFLRYGYGDLLREDRRWAVTHRIWPGTQRLLLWGDPMTAAAYSRAFTFSGSDGVEICEPLSFKGRRGSGIAGDRCAYGDASLRTRWDWQKYEYGTRVWGRSLYNPETDSEVWHRYTRAHFGSAAERAEAALANASRILPIITTAHGASAANNNYWPEVYLNQSMVDASHPAPYTDSPAPKVFGNVSPFDPQLFSRINDFADELLGGKVSGKYSPIEVAQWIEDYSAAATKHLAKARASAKTTPEFRRLEIDVTLQAGLGQFFGAKFRSGVLYRIYEKTGDRSALEASLAQYRKARAAWASLAERAKGVYVSDITVGEHPQLRGHWLDRLPAMDRDITAVTATLNGANRNDQAAQKLIQVVLGHPKRAALSCTHTPPAHFNRGQALAISLAVAQPAQAITLHYRRVNQAERFQNTNMRAQGSRYQAEIPAAYTDSAYPLEYYFQIQPSNGDALLYPGFSAHLTNQPYFVVRQALERQSASRV